MPLNTLRLNHQRSSHPNDRIVFIKPLPRPSSAQADYDLADTFLRAIAAQCLPLMKKHYLSVTTLEEYEPNPEFIGRNFNNGEIIQLVLRSKSGHWVPFNMVQMVMMHELAHNSHMNHGKLFWKTRNSYADEMKELWTKGYTGEGFWGSGRTLDEMGTVMGNNILSSQELEGLPLCGGTYRSRRRKRKARGQKDPSELSWKEKRDRRIEKKFGKNGVALGEDEDQRLALEINRKGPIGGKPRVAQSKRGRELRAAAALARFETSQKEVEAIQKHANSEDSEAEDGEDDYCDETVDGNLEDALDVNGKRLLDSRGQGMVRVCDDEDTDDINVQNEMTELENLHRYFKPIQEPTIGTTRRPQAGPRNSNSSAEHALVTRGENPKSDTWKAFSKKANGDSRDFSSASSASKETPFSASASDLTASSCSTRSPPSTITPLPRSLSPKPAVPPSPTGLLLSKTTVNLNYPSSSSSPAAATTTDNATTASLPPTIPCPICSLENPRFNAACLACAHVIDPSKDPRHWSCKSEACRDSATGYLNPGDAGVCGVCGARK